MRNIEQPIVQDVLAYLAREHNIHPNEITALTINTQGHSPMFLTITMLVNQPIPRREATDETSLAAPSAPPAPDHPPVGEGTGAPLR